MTKNPEVNYTLIMICDHCGISLPYPEPLFACNKCGIIKYNLETFNEHYEQIHKKEVS